MPHRFRYSVDGPTTMVLAPDGGQLFVAGYRFLGGSNADYWLTVVDPRTLHRLSARIPLPNCGASHLAQAAGQIVVLCTDSNDVRFADPATDRVTSTVSLHAMPVGLAVSRNGTDLYIVTDDLRILVVDAGTHRLVREVTAYRREAQTVPTLSSVAVTSDGAHLVVGVMARPRDPGSAFSLRVFALPSLTLVKSVPLPHFTHIVAAPGGGLYTFPMLDSPVADQNAPLQLLSPNLTRVQTAGRLRSPLNEVMIPGLNPQG
jgi:DNA-binding beta-propeller fold protein YncE